MGTKYEGDKKDVRTLNTYIKFMRAYESMNARLARHLSENSLTQSQFGALEALYHLGPLNQRTIGKKLLKSGGNITLVVDNLERQGWVERRRDPEDRRSLVIHLTPKGRSFIDSLFPKHLAKIREEFSVLSPDEMDELADLCLKLGGTGRSEGEA
ncbi:MAG: MarR family winged helix-turn-helix transcriptional regulator [Bacteroidota bacterium]